MYILTTYLHVSNTSWTKTTFLSTIAKLSIIMGKEETIKFNWLDLLKSLWYFLGSNRFKFTAFSITLLFAYFYDLVPPFIIGKIVDFLTHYSKGGSLSPFYTYVIGLGVSMALVAIIRLSTKRKMGNIRSDVMYKIRVEGFQHLLNFSLSWHEKENTGNKVQRIVTGVASMKQLIRLFYQELIIIVVSFGGIIGIFLFVNLKYSLILTAYLIVFFYIQSIFSAKLQNLVNLMNRSQENASGKYYEGITNILSIKSLGASSSLKNKINLSEDDSKKYNNEMIKISNTKWKFFQTLNSITSTLFIFMLGMDVVAGTMSIGFILVYWTYFTKLTGSAGDTTDYIDELIEIKQSIARMMPIFKNQISYETGKEKFPKNWSTIKIENGRFDYKSDDSKNFSIKNINLLIKRNEKIGIAGHSGSGKSTIAKILLGLYKFDSGNFKIDDTNYYNIDSEEVTNNITTVLQESELFNMSLLENITLFKEVPQALWEKAIKIARLEQLIDKLPLGANSLIGEKGYRVSGGERQRIGIARAICKNSPIIIFDEATSSLDVKTEAEIQKAIDTELVDKTIITIAHRISALQNSDNVYVFKSGEIVEEGKFNKLISDKNSELHKLNIRLNK